MRQILVARSYADALLRLSSVASLTSFLSAANRFLRTMAPALLTWRRAMRMISSTTEVAEAEGRSRTLRSPVAWWKRIPPRMHRTSAPRLRASRARLRRLDQELCVHLAEPLVAPASLAARCDSSAATAAPRRASVQTFTAEAPAVAAAKTASSAHASAPPELWTSSA